MTKSAWGTTSSVVAYVPKEKPIQETIAPFSASQTGAAPPTTTLGTNTGQRILAADGTWIAQPSFSATPSSAQEILRPSTFSTSYSANPPVVSNSAYAYDVDTNHATTFGEWDAQEETRTGNRIDIFTFSGFGSKTQTYTAATINFSRAYGYLSDGQGATGFASSVFVQYSLNAGTTWNTLLTDTQSAVPLAPQTVSIGITTSLTMSDIRVKVTLTRGAGGTIYEDGISLPGQTGSIDLKLYDIWTNGTYAGATSDITCNNLTVGGDATFSGKINLTGSSPTYGSSGQVLKSTGTGVQWATDTVGSGTVTSVAASGSNGIGVSGSPITTSGTIALSLGAITPTSISTGTGYFSGDVEFASSIKSPNSSNSPITIAPDGTGDVHLNADSVRIGDNNADATIATRGTGDLIITTNEGSATEGIIRIYDGANGNITLTPNGTGQVKVGTDQVVTLIASQTLTNKTISGSSNTLSNIANASLTNSTISGVALGSNLNALTISSPLTGTSFNGSSAVSIGIPLATTSVSGYLSSTDWTTFNNKGSGTVTSVTGTSPVVSSGGTTPAISIPAATTSVSGYLTSTDWTTFNNKGTGSVTSVSVTTANGVSGSVATSTTTPAITLTLGAITPTSVASSGAVSGTTGTFTGNTFLATTSGNVGIGVSPSAWGVFSVTQYKGGWIGSQSGSYLYSGQNNYFNGTDFKYEASQATTLHEQSFGAFVWYNAPSGTAGNTIAFTERMRLNSTGLGIGVSPSEKLSVNNTSGATTGGIRVYANDQSTARLAIQNTNGQSWHLIAGSNGSSNSGFSIYDYTNSATRLFINSGGDVGIGTVLPYNNLETAVSGGGTNGIANSASGASILYGKLAFYSTAAGGAYKEYGGQVRSYSGAGIDYGDLRFYTANGAATTERMRIDSSGNVGIGTTNATPANGKGLCLTSSTAIVRMDLRNTTTGDASGDGTSFYLNGNDFLVENRENGYVAFATNLTERMRIDSSGNVGIGTSSPASKLNVSGGNVTVSAGYGIAYSADQNRIMTPEDNVSGALISWGAGGICRFRDGASTERMRIDSSGLVGIGNSSPTEKLSVTGNIKASGVLYGNSGSKGWGAITTTTSTSTPTGGSAGDHTYIY